MNNRRDGHIDTDSFTYLTGFFRYCNRCQQNQHAETAPRDIQRNNIWVDGKVIVEDGAHDAVTDADNHQDGDNQVRFADVEVEDPDVQQTAFIRHVKLAAFWCEHRHQRGQDQVEGHHGLVNLTPEGVAETPVHAGVDVQRHHQVRQRVSKNQAGGRGNNVQVEQQERQRCGQEHHTRQTKLEVQHGVQVTQALLPFQTAAEQRIIHPENLRHTARPAGTLNDVQTQTFGRQTGGQRDIQKRGIPATTLHFQRGVCIFGNRFNRKTPHFFQSHTADNRTGAAEERRIPVVVTLLNRAVEQGTFVGHGAARRQVTFKRVR
ncbi:hypothetical protein SRABI106_01880 [Rahnella aquatilis]|nr:hypothetical protein SRABI106_01880 [Rahnella aquatilis]